MRKHRIVPPQKRIINQGLIDELNELLVRIKIHLFDELKEDRKSRKKPTVAEIDEIHAKVDQILFNDQESYIKY